MELCESETYVPPSRHYCTYGVERQRSRVVGRIPQVNPCRGPRSLYYADQLGGDNLHVTNFC